MKKDDIKIIFVDIDNTIYDHIKRHNFDLKSIEALNAMHRRGVQIIICTARPIYSIRDFGVFKYLEYDGIIGSNGAVYVYHDEWFDRYLFPKETIKNMLEVTNKYKLTVELITFDDRFYTPYKSEHVDLYHREYFENDACIDVFNNQDIIYILLYAPKELDDTLRKELPKEILYYRFTNFGVDLVVKDHNKGNGVKVFLEKLNISKDNAIAFGDDYQDIAMFKQVKYGIAVGNARDKVKENATEVTKKVSEHGVYHYLKKEKLIKTNIFGKIKG